MHRVFTSWLSRPLFVCLLPVMIVTLFLSLQEQPINWFLKSGTSIAVVCAIGWTLLQMARTPAEVSFRNDRVLIKTFLEASLQKKTSNWHYVIDVDIVRKDAAPLVTAITYGHTAFEFKENEWDQIKELTKRLHEAQQHYEHTVKSRVS